MSPKLFAKTTRENQLVLRKQNRGVANKLVFLVYFAEDFFASSPSANLVGVIEEGHDQSI